MGFNLPDDFSQAAFDHYWGDKLDACECGADGPHVCPLDDPNENEEAA